MSLPEHTNVPNTYAALAPYNFVPLPERVVLVPKEDDIPDQDRYHANRLSGRIECRLTTARPLYVRAGWQPEDFVAHGEKSFDKLKDEPGQQQKRADFFHHGDPQRPIIPGSSLRGMLRALVEIVGYGKMERVTERQHFFYRAVAAKGDDPLANPYRTTLANVRAGYLTRLNDHWAIIPAQHFGKEGYLKARQTDIPLSLGVMRFNNSAYQPQYIAVSFTTKTTKTGRMVIDQIDKPGIHPYDGMLITSGNMIETGSGSQFSPRKNHAVAGERQKAAQPIFIEDRAVEDYCTSLTAFQRGEKMQDSPFDRRLGVLEEGRPIFYCDPGHGRPITLFGQSPNFRVPYRFLGASRAATPRDFVPEYLRQITDTDLADAIFGYVRPGKVPGDQARAGRVFVSDAELDGKPEHLWYEPEVVTPKILSGPKPTTFQHYLVQTSTQKRNLMHYASRPTAETVVRGHKRYWHKPNVPLADMIERDLVKIDKAASQYTRIKPVAPGVSFRFTLRFENLSQIELGALLWVLRLAADERYRLALGMGKPLGMGAVSINSSVYRDDRHARYSRLLDGAQWHTGEQTVEQAEIDACLAKFEGYVMKESGEQERADQLDQTLRMRCLLALLSWKEAPPTEKTGYMELERFRERPVLPRPTQVIGWEPAPAAAMAAPRQPQHQQASPAAKLTPTPMPAAPAKPTGQSLREVGATFTGKILEVDADSGDVAVEVPGFTTDKAIGRIKAENLGGKKFKAGNSARVEVMDTRTLKSGCVVLELRPAQKPGG